MNSKQRSEYENMNIRRRNHFERLFMRKTYDALLSINVTYANLLKERGIDAVRTALTRLHIDSGVGLVIKSLYASVGLSYAKSTYAEVIKSAKEPKKGLTFIITHKQSWDAKLTGSQVNFNDKWVQDILQYFKMHLIDKAVVPITIQSKARIMQILDIGTKEGWTLERMANELETDKLVMYRARLIVRTETAKAAYYGRRVGAEDSGFETTKEWISANDSRTRHSHRDVDGETIDFNGRFNVPVYRGKIRVGMEQLRGPGDPESSAGNVCNCRCTESYLAKRDSNGRLIRKPISRISVIQPGSIQRPTITLI